MSLLAGLDLGTTSIKAVVFDSQSGRVLAISQQATPVSHPRPDWSEHDPQQLWQTVCRCLRDACSQLAVRGGSIHAIAISSMAEAGFPLNSSGQALTPAIAWFDRRSAPQASAIETRLGREALYEISGQRVTASFGITKWLWQREHQADIMKQACFWLPLPAYILYRLCGVRAVDYSIASRALLFDQNHLDWSSPLLDLAHLTHENLPKLAPGGTPVGQVSPSAAQETGLSTSTQCVLGGHDHLCAAFAAGGVKSGSLVDSTGTAEAVVLVVPAFQPDPSLGERGFACYAHVLPDQFILKGGLKAAGSSLEWLAKLLSPGEGGPDYAALEAEARACLGRSGPLWLPHLLESGSPEADPLSRGALVGVRLEHTRGDLFRAMLESLACWLRQNVEEMQAALNIPADTISLLGGTTRIRLFAQIKADMLNRPVDLPQLPEAAGVGAALLAGLGSAVFSSPTEALSSLHYDNVRLTPNSARRQAYEQLYRQTYLKLYPSLHDIHRRL